MDKVIKDRMYNSIPNCIIVNEGYEFIEKHDLEHTHTFALGFCKDNPKWTRCHVYGDITPEVLVQRLNQGSAYYDNDGRWILNADDEPWIADGDAGELGCVMDEYTGSFVILKAWKLLKTETTTSMAMVRADTEEEARAAAKSPDFLHWTVLEVKDDLSAQEIAGAEGESRKLENEEQGHPSQVVQTQP